MNKRSIFYIKVDVGLDKFRKGNNLGIIKKGLE